MKKFSVILAALALVLGVGSVRAHAEEGAVATPNTTVTKPAPLKAIRAEAVEDRKETREDVKNVAAKASDDKKSIIKSYAERVVGRLNNAITILTDNANKIEARITKIETEKKITLTDAKAKLAEARTAIAAAQTAVNGVSAKVDTALADAKPREAFKSVREVLETANQSVKTAHKALVETLRLVKVELEKNKPTATTTPKVENEANDR